MATCGEDNGRLLPSIGIIGNPDHILTIAPILKSEGFPLKAIWCKSPEVAQKLAGSLSIDHCPPTFQSLLLLQDVDLVYVATEPLLQAEVAVKALTSGKHCISMKPPSLCAREVEKMVSLSQYYSQLSTILETHMRFVPCFVKLKQMIDSCHLGNILTFNVQLFTESLIGTEPYSWKCDPSLGGGVLNLLGSDIIDLISFLCSQQVQQIHCLLNTFMANTHCIHGYRTIESDDYCSLQLKFSSSLLASVVINANSSIGYRLELTVTGTEGTVFVRDFDLYWQTRGRTSDDMNEKVIFQEDAKLLEGQMKEASALSLSPKLYQSAIKGYSGLFKALRNHFVFEEKEDNEGEEGSDLATFTDAHHLRTVLDCARESNKTGQWITVSSVSKSLSTNPFWTTGTAKGDTDKMSGYPVGYI